LGPAADYDRFAEGKMRRALRNAWKVSILHYQICYRALTTIIKAHIVSRVTAVVVFLPFTPYEAIAAAGECFYEQRRQLGPYRPFRP